MLSAEMKALIQAAREEGLRYIAAHPEEFEAKTEEEGWCHACENARTVIRCVNGHNHGNCDCDTYEVPCHSCR